MHPVRRFSLAAAVAVAAVFSAAPAQAALMGFVSGCLVIPGPLGGGGSCPADADDDPLDRFGPTAENVTGAIEFISTDESFLRVTADLHPTADTLTITFTETAGFTSTPLIPGLSGGPVVFGFAFSGLELTDAGLNPLDIVSLTHVSGLALGSTSVTASSVAFEIQIDSLTASQSLSGVYQLAGTPTQQPGPDPELPAPDTLLLAAAGLLAAARRARRR